ncbi:MAG: hypothetical protein QW350_03065 [Candidatus Aenigmatarchaeota archaeon]
MRWFLLFLFIPIVAAWGFDTHIWICEKIYNGNKDLQAIIKNKTLFLEGCNAPDNIVNDQKYHNCYYAAQCKKIDTNKKAPGTLHYFDDISLCFNNSYFSCPTLEKFNQTIKKDDYSIGMAIHYYSDAFVPLHQVTGEDYFSCHKPFEDKIDKMLNKKDWVVEQKCSFSFPCKKAGTTIKKCNDSYTDNIYFSYDDLVKVLIETDKEVSRKLNINSGNYDYLFKKTGFFYQILEKIQNIIFRLKQGFLSRNNFS